MYTENETYLIYIHNVTSLTAFEFVHIETLGILNIFYKEADKLFEVP